jgi:hypothetical protein
VRARALGAALAALVLACGPDESVPPAAPPGGPSPSAQRSAPAAPREEAGRARVERLADGRFRVRSRGASRFLVLQELAGAARFTIRPGAGVAPPLFLDLDLDGVSAEAALARILAGVPYHLHYEADAPGGEVALRRVTVGLLPGAPGAPAAAPSSARASGGGGKTPSVFDRGARQGRALGEAERRAEIEANLHARSDEDRARAASLMRADEQLPELGELLAKDPSPLVRARAATSLGEAEGGEPAFHAVDALLGALGDADAGVVAAAVAALEDLHDLIPDPRIRAAVSPLAGHADPRVRAAAESFREWTEDER